MVTVTVWVTLKVAVSVKTTLTVMVTSTVIVTATVAETCIGDGKISGNGNVNGNSNRIGNSNVSDNCSDNGNGNGNSGNHDRTGSGNTRMLRFLCGWRRQTHADSGPHQVRSTSVLETVSILSVLVPRVPHALDDFSGTPHASTCVVRRRRYDTA